jgi:hypothetical protein
MANSHRDRDSEGNIPATVSKLALLSTLRTPPINHVLPITIVFYWTTRQYLHAFECLGE